MTFTSTAGRPQQAGYRACKRCRLTPRRARREDVRADLVARAMRLIADGTVDRDGVGWASPAGSGTSTRQCPSACSPRRGRRRTARPLARSTGRADGPGSPSRPHHSGFADPRVRGRVLGKRPAVQRHGAYTVFATTPTDLRRRAEHSRRGFGDPTASATGGLAFRLPFRRYARARQPVRAPPRLLRCPRWRSTVTAPAGARTAAAQRHRRGVAAPRRPTASPASCTSTTCATSPPADRLPVPASCSTSRRRPRGPADGEALSDDPLPAQVVAKRPRATSPARSTSRAGLRVVLGQQGSTAPAHPPTPHAPAAPPTASRTTTDGGLTHAFPRPRSSPSSIPSAWP